MALLALLSVPARSGETPAPAAPASTAPVSAACTTSLINAMTAEVNERGVRAKELAAQVRAKKELLIVEVRALLGGEPVEGDAFSSAARLESLHRRLSDADWSRGVDLWADWIVRAEKASPPADASDYCGLRAEGRSFAQDARLIVLPFSRAAKGDDSLMPVFHFAAASGVIGLGLDAVTFVPNMGMSLGQKLTRGSRARKAERARKRLAEFVESAGKPAKAPTAH